MRRHCAAEEVDQASMFEEIVGTSAAYIRSSQHREVAARLHGAHHRRTGTGRSWWPGHHSTPLERDGPS